MARSENLSGVGGSLPQPVPIWEPIVIRPVADAEMPGLVPYHVAGSPVRSLAFTGRGITMFAPGLTIASVVGVTQRRLAGQVPFRGFVRTFHFGVGDPKTGVQAGLVWSDDEQVADVALGRMDGDEPVGYVAGNVNLQGLIGYHLAQGAYWSWGLNYLLPKAGLNLKYHIINQTGSNVVFIMAAEVLEVIER